MDNVKRKQNPMRIISRVLVSTVSLFIFSQALAQDTSNYRTVFPSGIFIGYGLGSYSVRDEYISKQRYSGTLTYVNVEWVRFHDTNAYRLAFEYRSSGNISNNKISAKVGQFTFSQDFSYSIGKFPGDIHAYVGPSVQIFYYGIDFNFAEPGTFISPKTFGVVGSLGINAECIYRLSDVVIFESLLRSNVVSFTAKDNDEQKYGDESGPALTSVFTATKIDFILSARLRLIDDVSVYLGYKFDFSRINRWDPYVAASNSLFTSINYEF
jgi:hypothetical protein